MLKRSSSPALLLCAVMLTGPSIAQAYEAGDWLLKFGAATVDPKSESDDIDQIPGAAVSANSNTQLGISAGYMFTEHWSLELLAATPFNHDIEGTGALDDVDIGSIKHLPPTLTAQYYFMGNRSAWQPYLGAGINFTFFFDEQTASDIEAIGYDSLSLDNSVGFAGVIGLDYEFSSNWLINISAMYAQIGTKATLKGPGVADLTVDYDLDPWVYRLNVGYAF